VIRAEIVACPQFPTTLPTLDEMVGLEGVTEANVAERLLEKTADPRDHVFTLHAELEGMKLLPAFERLLEGWKAQGYNLVPLRTLVAEHPHAAAAPAHRFWTPRWLAGRVVGHPGASLPCRISAIACAFEAFTFTMGCGYAIHGP
jgi:hypothetical protein